MKQFNYIKLYKDFKNGDLKEVETLLKDKSDEEFKYKKIKLNSCITTLTKPEVTDQMALSALQNALGFSINSHNAKDKFKFMKFDKSLLTAENKLEILNYIIKNLFEMDIVITLDEFIVGAGEEQQEAVKDLKATREEFYELNKTGTKYAQQYRQSRFKKDIPDELKKEMDDHKDQMNILRKHIKYYKDKVDKNKIEVHKLIMDKIDKEVAK